MKREQRGESREERDYNLLSNWLRFLQNCSLLSPPSSLLSLLGNTKKVSLRGNEVAVAISLFAIRRCLNGTPRRFAPRGDNFVVGLKFMTDPNIENFAKD
uniref:Uncharacterized protein n=1 Tax=candidate division WOR-3 bacterium TaxID=2052148 RepID=A0A7C4Y4Y8_UNCW3